MKSENMAPYYRFIKPVNRYRLKWQHNRRKLSEVATVLIVVFFCMITVFVLVVVSQHTRKLMSMHRKDVGNVVEVQAPKPPGPAEPMSVQSTERRFTSYLWRFFKSTAERVYFYQHFLESSWNANSTHLELWRSEVAESMGNLTTDKDFILTRMNTAVDETLEFYLNKKPKGKPAKHYTATAEFVEELPIISPLRKRKYRRCSVIGNSGILRDSLCGDEIDKADFVFRCNAAPLKPFKKDAGIRSNLTTMNPSIFFRIFGSLRHQVNISYFIGNVSQYNGMLWLPCFGVESLHGICLKAVDVYNLSNPRVVVGNPDHFRLIWDFWKQRKFGTNPLSTGFYLIHVALSVCDETHLYGFWPFSTQVDSLPGNVHEVPYHYFDKQHFTKAHDMNHEFLVLLQMHKLGLLRMHVGKCKP